jgi:hypothetical protein
MGFLDTIKSLFGGAKNQVANMQSQMAGQQQGAPQDQGQPGGYDYAEAAPSGPTPCPDCGGIHPDYDLAGFDPNDENSFFEAVLHMESEGQFGGTDESRAQIMQQRRISDRLHWQKVRDTMYGELSKRFGSFEAVHQAESNWRTGQMQRAMQGNVAAKAASGELNPVEGISLAQWAAFNAGIVAGMDVNELLKANGIKDDRWQRVSAEWNARMARDTTFAIATEYGAAFQKASSGPYGNYAREANAARAANRDMTMPPPLTFDQYFDVLYAQDYGTRAGQDPQAILKSMGLTIIDWTDLGAYYGYYIIRNHARLYQSEILPAMKRAEAKHASANPGIKSDLDIQF